MRRCTETNGSDRCVLPADHPGPHQADWETEDDLTTAARRIAASHNPRLIAVTEHLLGALAELAELAESLTHTSISPITQGQRTIPRSHS